MRIPGAERGEGGSQKPREGSPRPRAEEYFLASAHLLCSPVGSLHSARHGGVTAPARVVEDCRAVTGCDVAAHGVQTAHQALRERQGREREALAAQQSSTG